MLAIGYHTVVLLDHRDDVLDQHFLESTTHTTGHSGEVSTTHTGTLTTGTSLGATGTLAARTTLRHSLRTRATRTRTTEAHRLLTWAAGIQTIIHEDDEGHSLAIGNQVVHDDTRLTLSAPARLVLTHAMLQVEHGELLVGVGIILCRQIDISVTHRLSDC